MSNRKIDADPTKRHRTRYRGISYRERKDGRTYSIYHGGRYVLVAKADVIEPDDVAKAIEMALDPYNEILHKMLDRMETLDGAVTASTRKSLDGQESPDDLVKRRGRPGALFPIFR